MGEDVRSQCEDVRSQREDDRTQCEDVRSQRYGEHLYSKCQFIDIPLSGITYTLNTRFLNNSHLVRLLRRRRPHAAPRGRLLQQHPHALELFHAHGEGSLLRRRPRQFDDTKDDVETFARSGILGERREKLQRGPTQGRGNTARPTRTFSNKD